MAQGHPQTNTHMNEQLLGSERLPLQHRVDKVINNKQQRISKVAEEITHMKRIKEEEKERVELTGTDKIIQAKEKKKKDLA